MENKTELTPEQQEAKSPVAQMINETSDFLHAAFCVLGEVKFVKMVEPAPGFNCDGMMFEITDKKRGLFFVTISRPRD